MVFESASAEREPNQGFHETLSKAAMSDNDFHRLNHKYHTTNVENAGTKQDDCGHSNQAKYNQEGAKSHKFNPGMQTKGSQKEKFFGKGWRNRPKVISNAGNALWAPDPKGNYVWCSVGGRKVCLGSFDICVLSEPERFALQQVALSKLRKLNLRSHVTIPKSSRADKRTSSLKRALSLKSRLSIGSSDKAVTESAVFAVPLRKAVAQSTPENIDKKMKKGSQEESLDGKTDDHEQPRERRHSASSLNQAYPKTTLNGSQSKASLQCNREPPGSPTWKSRLIDALTLNSSSASASCIIDRDSVLMPQPPRVPTIVTQAIEHLENYGLHVLGIFRTGGSKRRMKQMREQFDSGEKKQFSADDNPHDVAALFKEYFRDLPEPLLTRELYAAFLESQGIDDENQRRSILQLLCCLLPPPNRDTLKALLEFLSKVDYYSEDRIDEKAIEIPGNKMNSRNLATLIGPNILHKVKARHNHDYAVDDPIRAEELRETIDTVEELITIWKELFVISADLYNEVYQHLLENEPEIVDYLLRKKTPIRISGASEDEEVLDDNNITPIVKAEPYRVRCRSAGDSDRLPKVIRSGNTLTTRPPPDYHQHRHRNPGYIIKSSRHVPHTRSHSLNREEGNTLRKYARQLSNTDSNMSTSFNGIIRARQRTPPPHARGAYKLEPNDSPPSLSSSLSHSNYSTPPSSPPMTPYLSAESSCSSPVSVSYLGSEGPVVTELEELLCEVEKDLQKERASHLLNNLDLENDIPDWQLEHWIRWESLAHRRSSNREALEQETLV